MELSPRRKSNLAACAGVVCFFSIIGGGAAFADTFGSAGNTFTIDFVSIGNAGNAADSNGRGSVATPYRISTYEVSEDMVSKANAAGGLGISQSSRGANFPTSNVSWNEAARFVNWLNTSQGHQAAYKFAIQPGQPGYSANSNIQLWQPGDIGYDPNNRYRNSLANYFLPSEDEWYKAAYYDPGTGNYLLYPTGSNVAPSPTAGGTLPDTAVYDGQSGPAVITQAGGASPYGTVGQGGNIEEILETSQNRNNNNPAQNRLLRGGAFNDGALELTKNDTNVLNSPSTATSGIGFRVASVPEPGSAALLLGAAGLLALRRRRLR
ncbi:MAG: SUMF1/EgtB/PvdO family nonheme iron enzyme [Verrucomicrobiota bacterium]